MLRTGLLGAVVVALDLLAVVLGLLAAHTFWLWWRPHLAMLVPIPWWALYGLNPFMPPGLGLLAAWIVALRMAGLYDPGQMTSPTRIARGLSRATIGVLGGAVVLNFFLPAQTWSRVLVLAACGATSLCTAIFRFLFFKIQAKIPSPLARVRVGVVGTGEDAARMGERLERFGHGLYVLVGYLSLGDQEERVVPEDRILGDIADFQRIVNASDLRVVLLASFNLKRDDALDLATRADQMGLKVYQVPFTWGAANPRVDLAKVGDLQLIDLTVLAYPTLAEGTKRAMDLALVALGGLLLTPLLVAVAAAIKLRDHGPVLFVQPRAGRGGRQFPFFKFRSMVVDAEAQRAALAALNEADGALFKISEDPRVTPLGRHLRRWSIDELPQIWNVVRGDMNLVGPRPLVMADIEAVAGDPEIQYWLELRHKVKPGITGPWQVSGRSNLGFQEMVRLDIAYVQDWSLWGDVVVLLRTIPAVLRGRGAR